MANSRSVTETLNGSYMFTIRDYSVVTKDIGFGNHISGEFTAGGHKWAIYFYPDGMHQSTYVSLIIVLKSEATDVRAHLEVTVIDRSGNGNNRNRYNFRKPPYTFKQRDSHWGYRCFFKASVLETSDYLRDDCLRIYVTVGVVISTLHSDFAIENMEGSDITFNVSGEIFHAHKSILAARSTKLRSEFLQGVGAEGEEVTVQDIEPNVFKALLHFIYKDALAESELIADALTAKLLAAADRYDQKRLKSICESHLCKDISVNSVAHLKVREMGSGSNLFVVQGYSMVKDIGVRKYIASDEFTMGGCKWVLYFYPNGRSKETSAYLSLILSLKSKAEDVPGIFEFTLMDLSGNGKHLVKQHLAGLVPRMKGNQCYFRRAGLETSNFLRDDCLKIYCNLSFTGSLIEATKSLHEDIFSGYFDPEYRDDLAPKIPAPPEIMQDDADEDEAGEEGLLSQLEKELRKLLLNDDKNNDGDMEVDTYSVVVPKQEASKQEPVDNSPLKATSSAAGCGTPSASKSSKLKREHSGQGSKALNSAPNLKKARKENELKHVKDETASSSKSGATPPTGPVTEDEIKDFLPGMGQVATTHILVKFKSRLELKENKDAFAATLKRIAKIIKASEDRYYLVPR